MSDLKNRVARDLTEIERLTESLEAAAERTANHPLMPGGYAMVALADVASARTHDAQLDALERQIIDNALAAGVFGPDVGELMPETYDDDHWEPPLQTLLFWSEGWRLARDWPVRARPTIASEIAFIRYSLDWAAEHEIHFADFAKDISRARTRLENVVHAGTRVVAQGAPCMYDECRGARLVRTTVAFRNKDGEKAYRLTDWHCPRCKRSWSDDEYTRNLYAARERARTEEVDGQTWVDLAYAGRITGRPWRTIQTWVTRGELASLCLLAGRRLGFVSLDEVRELSEGKPKRKRKNARGSAA